LRDDKTLPPAATAHPAEDRSEECAVREMRSDADLAPGRSGGEQRAEETHVRVRRSEDSLSEWLRCYPGGCSHCSRHCPSHHLLTIHSPAGWAFDASRGLPRAGSMTRPRGRRQVLSAQCHGAPSSCATRDGSRLPSGPRACASRRSVGTLLPTPSTSPMSQGTRGECGRRVSWPAGDSDCEPEEGQGEDRMKGGDDG